MNTVECTCGHRCDEYFVCPECGQCQSCCSCDPDEFDADELGLDPEEEYDA